MLSLGTCNIGLQEGKCKKVHFVKKVLSEDCSVCTAAQHALGLMSRDALRIL